MFFYGISGSFLDLRKEYMEKPIMNCLVKHYNKQNLECKKISKIMRLEKILSLQEPPRQEELHRKTDVVSVSQNNNSTYLVLYRNPKCIFRR